MAVIALGNTAPVIAVKADDESTAVNRVPRLDLGRQITTFAVPDNVGVGEALQTVATIFASHHSDADPAWVESDDEVIASALSRQFGCPIGCPNDWENGSLVENKSVQEEQTITAQDVAPAASILTPTPVVEEVTA